jgi:ribose-phosphate pyrophosphokinase
MNNNPIIFSLFDNQQIAHSLHKALGFSLGELVIHHFPDEETLVKINTSVNNLPVILIARLERPDAKLATLLFAAETARALGAKTVGLIAPYLPYMRQDKSFSIGEGITSEYFAKFISEHFDWLMTIDPHLHRWHTLNEIYDIPAQVLHATESIVAWIKQEVKAPLLIGPDVESTQWIETIAHQLQAPFVILEKKRMGDRLVEVSIPKIDLYADKTPILIDDIISTANTMIAAVKHIHSLKMCPPICIGIHAIFAQDAYQNLRSSGVEKIITCNTIIHESNAIDVSSVIAHALKNQTHLF